MNDITKTVTILCVTMDAYFLEVDGQNIEFKGSFNADYFEEHYKNLGYTAVRKKGMHPQSSYCPDDDLY